MHLGEVAQRLFLASFCQGKQGLSNLMKGIVMQLLNVLKNTSQVAKSSASEMVR